MTEQTRIAVVDDEPAAREMVGDYLRMHGFTVSLHDGGASLRESLKDGEPDLIVLDLNMPDEDGLSVIRDLRSRTSVPVIMLTATASPIDRVVGLELGADDYVPKPCELRELLARIRSILRRGVPAAPAGVAAQAAKPASKAIRFGTKWFDVEGHRLRDDEGHEQVLSRSEYDLLKAFADHPRRILTRERLLALADARDPDALDRAIDVRINRIRKKIEPVPHEPQFIRTVRGIGYVFKPDGV